MPGCDIGCAWTRITAPTIDPISVEEAKAQARITDTNSDDVIAGYILAATEAAEAFMGRGLLPQTWKLVLDGFANVIPLPMASPLQNDADASPSTAVTVQYYDGDGTLQTLATTVYDVDAISRPGRVVLKPSQSWPSVQSDRRTGAVVITYVVGWTDPADVPERIKQGLKQYVTYLDADRDGMDIRATEARLAAERCWSDRVWWTPPEWGTA